MTYKEFWLKLFNENNIALTCAIILINRFVTEEQLIGVDSQYFNNVIALIKNKEKLSEKLDTQYLIDLVNTVFDNMEEDCDEN